MCTRREASFRNSVLIVKINLWASHTRSPEFTTRIE